MTDFSKCPSCKVPCEEIKDGTIRFHHDSDCKMGKLRSNQRSGCLGVENHKFPHDAKLCSCGAVHSSDPFGAPIFSKENAWRASNECSICWAREAAKNIKKNMSDITLSEDQEKAYNTIAEYLAEGGIVHKKQTDPMLLSLGGYAGTGKTTLVSALAKEFGSAIRFAFCALSGRAASVLGTKLHHQDLQTGEGTPHYCGTIHSLIYQPIEDGDGSVMSWEKNPSIDYDVIVIDEASMVSEEIYKDLASYGVQILAVGDHGQLPPIEGKFSLMADPHIRLEKIHRQAENNPIIRLSMLIRKHGKIPDNYSDNEHVKIIKRVDCRKLLNETYKDMKSPEEILDTALLCYTNKTRNKMNTMIRKILYGSAPKTPMADEIVICLKNVKRRGKDPRRPLYNGFRGFMESWKIVDNDFYKSRLNFPFENIRSYEKNVLRHQFGYVKTFSAFHELHQFDMYVDSWAQGGVLFDYGYALTVHKAQGSQMKNVIIFNERPPQVSDSDYARWLYTAVSRSEDKLTVIM